MKNFINKHKQFLELYMYLWVILYCIAGFFQWVKMIADNIDNGNTFWAVIIFLFGELIIPYRVVLTVLRDIIFNFPNTIYAVSLLFIVLFIPYLIVRGIKN